MSDAWDLLVSKSSGTDAWSRINNISGGSGPGVCGSTNIRTKLQMPTIHCDISNVHCTVVLPVITAKIVDINHKKRVIS